MQYELAQKYGNGEMPADCYMIAGTERALVALIERMQFGCTIRKDTPPGHGFAFGRTDGGAWAFLSDEFLDADETRRNPDFRQCNFDTVADGVRAFAINGRGLFECVKGCRFMQMDAPTVYQDDPPPALTE